MLTTEVSLVEPLAPGDAPDVARLRTGIAPEGLLARLGIGPVEAFFWAAATDRDTFGLVVRHEGSVVGFGLCTTASVRLQRRAIRSSSTGLARALIVLGRDRRTLATALRRLAILVRPPVALDADPEPALRLFDIAVAPLMRGQGFGARLLDALIAEARTRGYERMGLTVLEDNDTAVRLYESRGFVRHRRGVRDDGRPFVTMRLDLLTVTPDV